MIIVAVGVSIFNCYAQRVLIQMGLLKSIKYLMFDRSALNGIVHKGGILSLELLVKWQAYNSILKRSMRT